MSNDTLQYLQFDNEYYLDIPNIDKQKYESYFVEFIERILNLSGYYILFNENDHSIPASEDNRIYDGWFIEEVRNIELSPIAIRNILYLSAAADNVAIYLIAAHGFDPYETISQSMKSLSRLKKRLIGVFRDIVFAYEKNWTNKSVSEGGAVIRKEEDGDGLVVYGSDKEFSKLCQNWPS